MISTPLPHLLSSHFKCVELLMNDSVEDPAAKCLPLLMQTEKLVSAFKVSVLINTQVAALQLPRLYPQLLGGGLSGEHEPVRCQETL